MKLDWGLIVKLCTLDSELRSPGKRGYLLNRDCEFIENENILTCEQ
jgi:hypothetical protein